MVPTATEQPSAPSDFAFDENLEPTPPPTVPTARVMPYTESDAEDAFLDAIVMSMPFAPSAPSVPPSTTTTNRLSSFGEDLSDTESEEEEEAEVSFAPTRASASTPDSPFVVTQPRRGSFSLTRETADEEEVGQVPRSSSSMFFYATPPPTLALLTKCGDTVESESRERHESEAGKESSGDEPEREEWCVFASPLLV
ncbi:hypothetical protein HDU98_005997 [Podochytrium sp. JEL0797]|nr:hypothetical protein HDU98_005997 [Podochytrium sp. JEL0797]